MQYQQHLDGCPTKSGANEAAQLNDLRAAIDSGKVPALGVANESDDLPVIIAEAARIRDLAKDVLVIGTGGSSLGGRALAALRPGGNPRLHFCDNLDGGRFADLLGRIDLTSTFLIGISKSGATAEVLAQVLMALPELEAAAGADGVAKQVLFITEPGPRPLRDLAGQWTIPVWDHHPDIGGRYSVFSSVGLLPAAIAGLDVALVRQSAKSVLINLGTDSAPVLGAATLNAFAEKNPAGTHVIMPYGEKLWPFTLWFRQLWAESLGKDGQGGSAAAALGPVDQHSQLQLWLDGPGGQFFTIITAPLNGHAARIDLEAARADALNDLLYLDGHSIDEVVAASAKATIETLRRHQRPVRVIELESLDEAGMGALFAHFMVETILVARAGGVNPFDQPAVDEGKRLTREYLGKS